MQKIRKKWESHQVMRDLHPRKRQRKRPPRGQNSRTWGSHRQVKLGEVWVMSRVWKEGVGKNWIGQESGRPKRYDTVDGERCDVGENRARWACRCDEVVVGCTVQERSGESASFRDSQPDKELDPRGANLRSEIYCLASGNLVYHGLYRKLE